MQNSTKGKLAILAVLASVIVGCVGQTATPSYARKNDVVTLQLGGVQAHWGGQAVTASDLNVTITDASGATYPVAVSRVFVAKADSSSAIQTGLQVHADGPASYFTAGVPTLFDKLLLADVTLSAADLQPGAATLHVSSPKIARNNVWGDSEGTLENFPIEVLPGEGSGDANQSNSIFQNAAYAQLKVSNLSPGLVVGGVEAELRYVPSAFGNGGVAVAASSSDPSIQLMSHRTLSQQDGSMKLKVVLTNPNGFTVPASWTIGQSFQNDLSVDISWLGANFETVANAEQALQLVSAKVFDVQGNLINGATATLAVKKISE